MSDESPAADAAPPEKPVGLFDAAVAKQFVVAGLGLMALGMVVWVAWLDPRPRQPAVDWDGWTLRDVLVVGSAALAMRGAGKFVWDILLFQLEGRGVPAEHPLVKNLGVATLQVVAIVLAVGILGLRAHGVDSDAIGLRPISLGWIAAAMALGLILGPGGLLAVLLISRRFGSTFDLNTPQTSFLMPGTSGGRIHAVGAWGMIVVGGILGPVAEEMLFRGVFFTYLNGTLGLTAALAITSVVFGLGHLGWGRDVAIITTIIGAAFGLLYVGSGSLWAPIIAHVLTNSKIAVLFAERAGWLGAKFG